MTYPEQNVLSGSRLFHRRKYLKQNLKTGNTETQIAWNMFSFYVNFLLSKTEFLCTALTVLEFSI